MRESEDLLARYNPHWECDERIKVLEKALDDATGAMSIVTIKQGDLYYDVHRYRPGDEVIVSGGTTFQEILGRTSDSPELAEWLRDCAIDEARGRS